MKFSASLNEDNDDEFDEDEFDQEDYGADDDKDLIDGEFGDIGDGQDDEDYDDENDNIGGGSLLSGEDCVEVPVEESETTPVDPEERRKQKRIAKLEKQINNLQKAKDKKPGR
jgi:hypothetical protein